MQAANGTQSAGDLIALDNEYQSMSSAIARIGANTEWNGKKIFDGVGFPGETKFQVGVDAGQTIGVVIDELTTAKLGEGFGGALVTHPTTPPSAVTTQDSFTSHSGTAPSAQTSAGVSASPGSDIDGDGDVDAIAIAEGKNSFKTFLNDGSGNFSFGSEVTGAPSGAIHVSHSEDPYAQTEDQALAVADIDGDGDADVITQRPGIGKLNTFLNDGAGNFSYRQQIGGAQTHAGTDEVSIEAADVDGDGDIDIIQKSSLSASFITLLNDGNGNFSAGTTTNISAQVASPGNSVALSAGDLDGDGDIDLLLENEGQNGFFSYLNNGTGNFTFHTSSATSHSFSGGGISLGLGDTDGDGDLDVLRKYDSSNNTLVFLNDGTGAFTYRPPDIDEGMDGRAIDDGTELADVDGDGDQDFIWMNAGFNAGHQFTVYKNDGSGGFTYFSNTPAAASGLLEGRATGFEMSASQSAVAAISRFNFSGVSLAIGDRVTITVPGGTNVSAVMDSNGLSTLLTSLGNSLAAQSSLFTGASNSGGTLTINGLADGSAMPSLSVTLEDGVDTSRLDFNTKNLVEGDQIVIKVSGGTDVQGTIDSNGLDTLLGTLATQLQSQSSLFSIASISSGVLSLTGLTNGAAVADVTVEMNTSASQIGNTSIRTQTVTSAALGSVDKAIEDISVMRSKYGATLNQLLAAINNLTTISTNASNSKSTVEDADYAQESSNLASAQIRNQGAKATLAQANTDQQLVMKLIEDWLQKSII